MAMVREAGVTLEDFGRLENEEVIRLSRKREIGFHGGKAASSVTRIEYADTPETNAMREAMRRINAGLENAAITFEGRGLGAGRCPRPGPSAAVRDPRRRPYGASLDLSGRLFGGFWQGLQRERRAGIGIDGERLATIDFSSMFARLAYASKGVQPPAGDLYAIPDSKAAEMQSSSGSAPCCSIRMRRRQWPKTEEPDQRLPRGWTLGKFRTALLERQPILGDCSGRDWGFHLMHTESEIMVRVLTTLLSEGITALPLHDGMLGSKIARQQGQGGDGGGLPGYDGLRPAGDLLHVDQG